jgi:toxin ParE1/3/4
VTLVVISPAAESDLEEIWAAIAAEKPSAASRLLRKIAAQIDRLATHPRLGPRRPDIRPEARMLIVSPYLILFETHPDTDEGPVREVEIIRVVDGRRDLAQLF